MDDSSKKGRNASGDNKGSSAIWFAIIVAASLGITGLMIFNQASPSLSFKDFQRLLEATRFEGDDQTKLITNNGALTGRLRLPSRKKEDQYVEYSQPTNVKVGDRSITGQLLYRMVDANGSGGKKESVSFQVKKPAGNDLLDEKLEDQLTASNIGWEFDPGPSALEKFAFPIVSILLIFALFYYMMRKLGGAGGPMQFGRSRGKLHVEEDLGLSFSDVAGIDEAVEEVKEVVDFLRYPEKYQKLGGRIPRGVLLVGPPGTGKTLLAQAVAGEAGVPFFSLSGSDFVEMFVGVGAARVRDMFQVAEAKAPCIIFIDELDALGKTRGGNAAGGHDEREQTLNALLVEMDGFSGNNGVIVMAATNRPETLDEALMRPGRFDRHVLVDRPDVKGREAILKVHVKNVKLDPDVELKQVAAISPGFGGAELANLVNEAALLAARHEQSTVVMENFNEGVERVTAGLEKKQRVMNQDEKQRVAYHEAGHALVAYSLPNTDPVHKVSIIPRGLAALGYTMQRPTDDRYLMTQGELESQLKILLAGTMAEEMIYDDISTGASNDLERATDIARAMVMQYGMSDMGRINFKQERGSAFLTGAGGSIGGRPYSEKTAHEIDEEVARIISDALESVRKMLVERKAALVGLTDRLIEVESVDSVELKRIMDETLTGPMLVPGTEGKASKEGSPPLPSEDSGGKTLSN